MEQMEKKSCSKYRVSDYEKVQIYKKDLTWFLGKKEYVIFLVGRRGAYVVNKAYQNNEERGNQKKHLQC